MRLTNAQIETIENKIKEILRKKLSIYKPETHNTTFHHRFLGRDRMALFSFIHSLNTTFGVSIFQPVAETLASLRFPEVKRQFIVGNEITEMAQREIQSIINQLALGETVPNKLDEIERIRLVASTGKVNRLSVVKADLFIKDAQGNVHLFDLKTVKPNISNFKDFKRTLLEWIAIYLFQYPNANVQSYIVIPYNPYEPRPYERWTLRGMIDLKNELKVAEEFWDFLGGNGAYWELLGCFERAGIELRQEIDEYFSKFKENQ